ncbi:MAG TPA: clostripain-related cysteine peptidase [Longimicrobium sp.]|nr:clostripain-related cysteine peptidase [Longimicrobium sp.]
MRAQSATQNVAQRPLSTTTPVATRALPQSRNQAAQASKDSFEAPATRNLTALGFTRAQVRPEAAAPRAPAQKPMNPQDIKPANWTMFVHLNADNNLESFGKADMNEMETVGSLEGKVNVIALVDGGTGQDNNGWTNGTRLMYVTKDPNNSNKIVSREIAVDPKSDLGKLLAAGKGELDTGSPEVLRAAVDYVQKNIPSEHFMLDLWDHGNSWKGISYDDRGGDLNMPELQQALSGLSKKVDIVSADACLMASVEVADTAKAVGADWLVGSEELEPGAGWNYNDLLKRMDKLFEGGKKDVTAEQMSKVIVESYSTGPKDNVTLSATNLTKLDGLNAKLDSFSDAVLKAGGLQNKTVRDAYTKALRMDDADQMDLGDFAKRLAASTTDVKLKGAANELLKSLADTTFEKGTKSGKFSAATGLTIYAPRGAVSPDYKQAGSAWLNSRWNDVIKTYAGSAPTRLAA